MGRVQLGTCTGPADAALVRSYFEAHGIPVVINAENHAGLFGGLGGGIVPMHIYVDDDHADTGAQLLRDLRGDEAEAEAPDADELDIGEPDPEALDELRAAQLRRRRTVFVVLLAFAVTFGTAHAFTGAWKRAAVLLVTEGIAISYIANDRHLGVALLAVCMVCDLVGALVRVRRANTLPGARALA